MISLINVIPPQFRLAAGAIGILVLCAAGYTLYAVGHADGYHLADVEWTVKYQKREADLQKETADELARQQAISDAAKTEEEAENEAERKRQMAAADRGMTLAAEAAADPNHDNIALDADAVDRYNRRISE